MPDAGQSQAELIGSEPAPWLQPGEDGTVGVDPDMIREFFLQDCDETTTEHAVSRLTRQSLTPFTQAPRQIAWRQKPATYVDPGILWVSYFNGGDALHYYDRASYGSPQSNGCVEMPLTAAAKIWPYTPVGALVDVST